MRTFFAPLASMENRLFSLAFATCLVFSVGCSRETTVYSDPVAATVVPIAVVPISTDRRASLPKDFYAQSVNQATVDLQPDGVSSSSKAIRFQTTAVANQSGGFNGAGLGNRALLGLGSWHSRPLNQAEPITFDAQVFTGSETIGVNLQIDLNCDGHDIRVVNAAGAEIAAQATTSAGDGYTRFTASQTAPIWLSPTSPIFDGATELVPATGAPVSLDALLTNFPAACLKNAATAAVDLPRGIPTAAILWSLGTDATASLNSTFVRRFTVGSEIFEGLE
jgi:hypothetical protein